MSEQDRYSPEEWETATLAAGEFGRELRTSVLADLDRLAAQLPAVERYPVGER